MVDPGTVTELAGEEQKFCPKESIHCRLIDMGLKSRRAAGTGVRNLKKIVWGG
jgi:hypothetical protein